MTYSYVRKELREITSAYPHDPYSEAQSVNDYLAAQVALGLKLQSLSVIDGGVWYFVFKDHE